MRLRNIFVPAAAVGLAFTTPSCGLLEESSTIQQAKVTGYDHTLAVHFEELQWQDVREASSAPRPQEGVVRNIVQRTVSTGCREVPDDASWWEADETDSWDCFLSNCSTEAGDPTHCEETYKVVWDYEKSAWIRIGSCAVSPEVFEIKRLEPRKDDECTEVWRRQTPSTARREVTEELYFFASYIKNSKGEGVRIKIAVDPTTWSSLDLGECVELRVPDSDAQRTRLEGFCKETT